MNDHILDESGVARFGLMSDYEQGQVENPPWEKLDRVHCWRNYIPSHMQAIWREFTPDQQAAIYVMAADMASNEEWD